MRDSGFHDINYANKCRSLWSAVLATVVRDMLATKVIISDPEDTANERHRAKAWLFSRRTGMASFAWVCTVIGYDKDRFLKSLMKRYEQSKPVYKANYKKIMILVRVKQAALAQKTVNYATKQQLKIRRVCNGG